MISEMQCNAIFQAMHTSLLLDNSSRIGMLNSKCQFANLHLKKIVPNDCSRQKD